MRAPDANGQTATSASRNNSAVVITGASRGLGAALAREFAKNGRNLVLVARNTELLTELANEIVSDHGVKVYVHGGDLAEQGAPERLEAFCRSHDLEIDGLINNAALLTYGPFAANGMGAVGNMIELNMRAATELTALFLPAMLAKRHGNIINISSIASLRSLQNCAVYSATKAYLTALSEALRAEIKGTGVTCSTVLLGPLRTDMLSGERTGAARMWLLNRLASSPETAAAVIYDGSMAGRQRYSAGWLGASMLFGISLLPRSVSVAIARQLG